MTHDNATPPSPAWHKEDSGLSSLSASSRYSLSKDDERPILSYDWRGETSLTTQKALVQRLGCDGKLLLSFETLPPGLMQSDTPLRVTKKPIPRGQSIVEIKRHDLYLDEERTAYKGFPNYDSSLAAVSLPTNVVLRRALSPRATYDQLYIVSPETSPDASMANSAEGTGQKNSRASTGLGNTAA